MADSNRVDELVRRWEDAWQRGIEMSPEELCRDCPELLDAVRDIIDFFPTKGTPSDSSLGTEPPETRPSNAHSAAVDTTTSVASDTQYGNIRPFARGGLGFVCTAEDISLHRDVAIKFIRPEYATVEDIRERFLTEAEITGRLEHPGIVPVHGVGCTDDGRVFYVMRLIQGETLDAAIDRYHRDDDRSESARRSEFQQLLRHFVSLCKTVAYAHNRGVVHRDIKPANVMLGHYGETLLVDWGLAMSVGRPDYLKREGEPTLYVSNKSGSSDSSGRGAGTPAYMSPEQANESSEVDQASDIYNLGATLYHLLTGRPPIARAETLSELRRKIVDGEFARPHELRRGVPPELEAVCLRAMAPRPADRYLTALGLAQDIENFFADNKVGAYDEPLPRRFARWGRRHWAVLQGLMGGLFLVILVALGAVFRAHHDAGVMERERDRARTAQRRALDAGKRERELRRQSISTSATFAAKTLANHIDVCWRILEQIASEPKLSDALTAANQRMSEPQGPAEDTASKTDQTLQEILDASVAQHDVDALGARCFALYSANGYQIARSPCVDADGKSFTSLGRCFAFRDYFHGRGADYFDAKDVAWQPLNKPRVAAVHQSTNDHRYVNMFSVPIRSSQDGAPIGVLCMGVNLGALTALTCPLPEGQDVALIETRKYLVEVGSRGRRENAEGIVLYHPGLDTIIAAHPDARPPHVSDDVVAQIARLLQLNEPESPVGDGTSQPASSAILSDFRIVGIDNDRSAYLAAVAPVIVESRGVGRDGTETPPFTGWCVVVRQPITTPASAPPTPAR